MFLEQLKKYTAYIIFVVIIIILCMFLYNLYKDKIASEKRSEQNILALIKEQEKYRLADNSLMVEKYNYLVSNMEDLKKINASLYGEFNKMKKDIIAGISSTVTVSSKSYTVPVYITQKGHSGTIDLTYEDKKGSYERFIRGNLPFVIDSVSYKLTTPYNFNMTKDVVKFKLLTGFEKTKDGNYKAFGNVEGTDIDLDIDGFLVDKHLKGHRDGIPICIGIQGGYGYAFGLDRGVPYIGLGISYPAYDLRNLFD